MSLYYRAPAAARWPFVWRCRSRIDKAFLHPSGLSALPPEPLAYTNYTQRLAEYFRYQFGHSPKIELYDHHLCHAASSFYGSGFSETTVACFDFSGDSSSGLVAHARGNDFRVLTRFGRHNSLGLYYGMLTQYLGYQMNISAIR